MKEYLTILLIGSIIRWVSIYLQEEQKLMYEHKSHKPKDLFWLVVFLATELLGIIFIWRI